MADDIGGEPEFSQAQIRTIAQIVAAALAQDRAQNQTSPPSSSQPVVEERQTLDPVSDNQTSMGNTTPVENDMLKQLAELKERFDKMAAMKEKDPATNFHITEYVLHPSSSTSFKTFKHTIFEGDNDPRSHLSEFLRVSQMNRYNEEDVLRAFSQKLHKDYRRWYDGLDEEVQKNRIKLQTAFLKHFKTDESDEFGLRDLEKASTESEWLKKISKFEDFLGIGDEASKLVQEQKGKARILQSVLAAEDAEEVERKALKPAEEKIEATSGGRRRRCRCR
ncbi:hypothetical protein JCGZ_00339 [Jatropha curcas]|uniref:Retrotransposon gag domain-containing protein n=1 Tax=Jatropha curcas TaxID=180498 RepID=A0A067JT74_JATCU|nr:hypothetical protein JCGZ_00339 [Jatropha curcas]